MAAAVVAVVAAVVVGPLVVVVGWLEGPVVGCRNSFWCAAQYSRASVSVVCTCGSMRDASAMMYSTCTRAGCLYPYPRPSPPGATFL